MTKYSYGSLTAKVLKFGDGYVILIGGGKIHVGAVSLGEPYTSHEKPSASISTITRYSHRDDAISASIARQVVSHLQRPVVVIAGFHQNNLSRTELAQLLEDSSKLGEIIVKELSKNNQSFQRDS
ncbi:MAG: hypothetical protein ACFFCQ_04180 [Promethearchaeota archaeon]